MYIRNIGYNHSHNADFTINRPQGSGDYMLLLLKTPAIFTLGGADLVTKPDSFILYSEQTPQFYRAMGANFSNDWFHFKLDKPEDGAFLSRLTIPLNEVIPIGDLNELSMIINNLCYETYSSNPHRAEIIELFLQLFFIKLSNNIHSMKKDIGNTHFNKMSIIRAKIYNKPFLDWNIEGISHELTMSRSSFQHLYKDLFGVTPMADVITSRLDYAKYLLTTTDIPVKKVAEMSGYNNEIHFMRQFKQHVNQTPSQYRAQKAKIYL